MLQIDSLLLEAFYLENKDFFENAKVQKIQQPTRKELLIQLRKNTPNGAETKKLYININPQHYHICFVNSQTEAKRNLIIPNQPPMFCMLLRKHMDGAKIVKANKPENERIMELYFENYNEIGDRIEECLSIELMGKHSNIVLYNTDNNIILGCAHNIGEEKSKERELSGGLPYIYPPKQDKKDILKTRFDWFESALLKSNESIKKSISQRYFSLSQFMVEEICNTQNVNAEKIAKEITKEEAQILFISLHEFMEKNNKIFSVSKDYTKYSCVNNYEIKYSTINDMIDDYYSTNINKNLIENLKSNLKTRINKEIKKLENTYEKQKKQLERKEKIDLYQKKGELLTANCYAIKKGIKKISLLDYEKNEYIEIELDEEKTAIENAQRYFALYNKGKKSFIVAKEMSEKTKEEIDYLKQILFDIEICSQYSELQDIAEEFTKEEAPNKSKKKNKEINVEKREIDNITIYIGKNNKQNDYLYSKISSPEDLWFHTLNTPGSHIILKKSASSQIVKDETILKVAQIAKEFSSAKNSTKVPVVYTLRKYIKRPNNTKSGFVVYKNETEIMVN